MNPLLVVKDLYKTYPNGVEALKGISFQVEKGEFVAVIGLSGSGKSTLLRCMNRLQDSSRGEILFRGQDIAKASPQEVRQLRRKMAMIFQHFNLIPRYSVLTNVLMGRLATTSVGRSLFGIFENQDKEKALSHLQRVGLSDKTQARVDQLSGGQQQRVAIARALAQEPDVLLADEPVSSLDPATSHGVMDLLKKANQELGVTIICNLHFLSLVRKYAGRVIALQNGKIVFDGPPEGINESWFQEIYGLGAKEVEIR